MLGQEAVIFMHLNLVCFGHFRTFLAANCGTKSRCSSVIGGMLPCFHILIPDGYRHIGSKYQGRATKVRESTCFFNV